MEYDFEAKQDIALPSDPHVAPVSIVKLKGTLQKEQRG